MDAKDERIDYDAMERLAREHKPKLIIAGASAYPRCASTSQRFARDRRGGRRVLHGGHGALSPGWSPPALHPDPVPLADFVTTTTHKTLRGPRGGMILCKDASGQADQHAVFPGIQGGPLMHVIAAKAVAFGEALAPEFKAYQRPGGRTTPTRWRAR